MSRDPTFDSECVRFLRWALPRRGFRWAGFRRVRRQVCRRLAGRVAALGLAGFDDYRAHLLRRPEEWRRFDLACRVTISRFWRDRRVWEVLAGVVLPRLAREAVARSGVVRVWSAGCGAGEEAYSLALAHGVGDAPPAATAALRILGTDLDRRQLERAARGVYPASSLRDLPPRLCGCFAERAEGTWRLLPPCLGAVELCRQDLRRQAPPGPFDLVLCRNLAFTYFGRELQETVLGRILARLAIPGYLVIGSHEKLPIGDWPLVPLENEASILERTGEG